MAQDADIEFTIGDSGDYTLKFHSGGVAVDISAFSAATITFTDPNTPSTAVASASFTDIGETVATEGIFSIPTSGFSVGNDEFHDYIAQVVLTGSGTRASYVFSCRVLKKLGAST